MGHRRSKRVSATISALLLSGGILASQAALASPTFAGPVTSFVWSGASTTSHNWSDAANWVSGVAPTGSTPIGTLTFPDLPACDTATPPANEACYASNNDLTNATADTLVVGTSSGSATAGYSLGGNALTVTTGINVTGNSSGYTPSINLPLTLTGSTQTWSFPNSGATLTGNVTGAGTAVTATTGNGTTVDLLQGNQVETGPFAMAGQDTAQTGTKASSNGYFLLNSTTDTNNVVQQPDLNGGNGNPVQVTDANLSGGGSLGNLNVTGGMLNLDQSSQPAIMTTGQASFDSASALGFDITSAAVTPGTDYSQLTSAPIAGSTDTGTVDLGGAQLVLDNSAGCTAPAVGTTFPLVQATHLTGTVSDNSQPIPDGGVYTLQNCQNPAIPFVIHYTATTMTATVLATSTTALAASSTSPQVGQPDTLTATVSASAGTPQGTVAFFQNGQAITGCSSQPVSGISPTQASCTTSFDQSGGNDVSATFTPSTASALAPSSGDQYIDVSPAPAPTPTSTNGYNLIAADGGVFSFGTPNFGSMGGQHLNQPIVGGAGLGGGGGYYLVASDGGIFNFGPGTTFQGSMGGKHLNKPIVGMAVDPSTGGYWMVASDGGVFSFGTSFYGSTGGQHLNQPIVGIAAAPDGQGYYLVAADGGVFAFGPGTNFQGSMGGKHLNQPIVGMTVDPSTGGYWMVASDGGMFSFGAPFEGSMGGKHLNRPIVGMSAPFDGNGYYLTASDGGVFSFGEPFQGSTGDQHLNRPIVGMTIG